MSTSRRAGPSGSLVLATVLGAMAAGASPAVASMPAQPPACVAFLDGAPGDRYDSPDRAVRVDADSRLVVAGVAPGGTGSVRIDITFPLLRWTVVEEQVSPRGDVFETVVDVADVARFGVGLYRVEAVAEGCRTVVWVKVVGASPFSTPAGLVVSGVAVVGMVLLVLGLARAASGRGGLVLAATGGAVGGLGAVGVAQQFGLVGITPTVLTTWIAVPGASSVVVQQVIARLSSAPPPAPPPAVPPPVVPPAAPPAGPAPAPGPPTSGPPPSVAPPPTMAPPPGDEIADPPRSAHARMDCPDAVVAERPFLLTVGLRPDPAPGVVGGPLVRPESSVGPYSLSVQVVADGFMLADPGGRWRHDLMVTAEAPYPSVSITLHAAPQAVEVLSRAIQALFSVDGQTMGMAVRSVAVVRRAELLGGAPRPDQDSTAVVAVPTDATAPDLTVRILRARSQSDGRLLWTFETPHPIACPDEEVVTDIGGRPDDFARHLVGGAAAHRGRPGLREFLRGAGVTVADQVPPELWSVLAAVAAEVGGRTPTVLLLSEEPYVPWELAVLERPLDADAPPFLAAQVDVGRWVLGRRRPPLPPPLSVPAVAMAVVSGVYHRAEWRLLEAEEEASMITSTYGATTVEATADRVLSCLQGEPAADVLHFSLHGAYDPDAVREGLILLDGSVLDPLVVRGSALGRAPFVFLNACQVGNGNEVLGDYAGLAEAFLHAGASAALAPLWSVDDVAARELALRFYERALAEGIAPAAVLRAERRAFLARDGGDGAATCLAYQFFGHPAMRLER